MRIIAVSHLRSFWENNLDAEQPLKSWVDEVRKATWHQPADIKDQYRSASVLTVIAVAATPDDERRSELGSGGERSRNILAA